jgi:hypothetical protein
MSPLTPLPNAPIICTPPNHRTFLKEMTKITKTLSDKELANGPRM